MSQTRAPIDEWHRAHSMTHTDSYYREVGSLLHKKLTLSDRSTRQRIVSLCMHQHFSSLRTLPAVEDIIWAMQHKQDGLEPVCLPKTTPQEVSSSPCFSHGISMWWTNIFHAYWIVSPETIAIKHLKHSMLKKQYASLIDFLHTIIVKPVLDVERQNRSASVLLTVTFAVPLIHYWKHDWVIKHISHKTSLATNDDLTRTPLIATLKKLFALHTDKNIDIRIIPNDTQAIQRLYEVDYPNKIVWSCIAWTGWNMSCKNINFEIWQRTGRDPHVWEVEAAQNSGLPTAIWETVFSAKSLPEKLLLMLERLWWDDSAIYQQLSNASARTLCKEIYGRGYGQPTLVTSWLSRQDEYVFTILCEHLTKKSAQATAMSILAIWSYMDLPSLTMFGDGSVLTKNPAHVQRINSYIQEYGWSETSHTLIVEDLTKKYTLWFGVEKQSTLDATLLGTMKNALLQHTTKLS